MRLSIMLSFNKTYFALAVILFLIEALIALFIHDRIIRPYFGDVLVVILIYCAIKSVLKVHVFPLVLWILAFACSLETLQYFNIVHLLGMERSVFVSTVIGNSFSWLDILAYLIGLALVLITEFRIARATSKTANICNQDELYI
jgi:hypothetical protein